MPWRRNFVPLTGLSVYNGFGYTHTWIKMVKKEKKKKKDGNNQPKEWRCMHCHNTTPSLSHIKTSSYMDLQIKKNNWPLPPHETICKVNVTHMVLVSPTSEFSAEIGIFLRVILRASIRWIMYHHDVEQLHDILILGIKSSK